MKRIPLILFFLILISGYISCDHDKLDTYSGQDDICFRYAVATTGTNPKDSIQRDSIIIRFGYDEVMKSDSIIRIQMQLLGDLKDYDRPINFVLDADSSTAKLGEDIELLHDRSVIYANSTVGHIYVKLKNTEKLLDTMIVAEIKTASNEYFIAQYEETINKDINEENKIKSNRFRIFFDASFDKPNLWADAELNFSRVFGSYSKVKFDFICTTLNLDFSYFTYNPATEKPVSVFNDRFKLQYTNGWKLRLENALIEYELEHGKALVDENGDAVIIGKFNPSL